MEGSGGDFKSPAHSLHHLPQIPPQISGGSRHWYLQKLAALRGEVLYVILLDLKNTFDALDGSRQWGG